MATKPRPTKARKRIVIVDDHALLRYGLTQLVNQQEDLIVCGEATDATTGLAIITATKPDLAIVDISLQGRSGLELIKAIHESRSDLPVLVLSMHDEMLYAERALRAGAMGYIRKQESHECVIGAIRRILLGEIYVSERLGNRMLRRLVGRTVHEPGPNLSRLSDRELEVFELLGQGRTTRQIAEQLRLSIKTVETHRAHLKDKLGLQSSADLLRQAIAWSQSQAAAGADDR